MKLRAFCKGIFNGALISRTATGQLTDWISGCNTVAGYDALPATFRISGCKYLSITITDLMACKNSHFARIKIIAIDRISRS